MSVKVVCKPVEEDFVFTLHQEGNPKCLINEGYLGLLVDALKDSKPRTDSLYESFCVTVSRESFILSRIFNSDSQVILNLSIDQAIKLGKWIESTYSVINHYHR